AAERELQQAQAQLNQAQQQLNETQPRIDQLKAELNTAGTSDARKAEINQQLPPLQGVQATASTVLAAAKDRVHAANASLQAAREKEVQTNEATQAKAAEESRAREEQFRREVAAASEDPDTYAPGDIDSDDPVRRVSVSVIGEGVIQLRGPIQGMNKIRTMI